LDLTLSVFYFQNANDMVLKSPVNALKEGQVRIFIDLFLVLYVAKLLIMLVLAGKFLKLAPIRNRVLSLYNVIK
jgi:hypothetical protein